MGLSGPGGGGRKRGRCWASEGGALRADEVSNVVRGIFGNGPAPIILDDGDSSMDRLAVKYLR